MGNSLLHLVQATKLCRPCGEVKPLEAFATDRNRKDGRQTRCRDCYAKYRLRPYRIAVEQARWKSDPKVRERGLARTKTVTWKRANFEYRMRKDFGITVEDWARLYESQHGLCAGCARDLAFDWTTHVDHSHATGVVRGLLCTGCNTALGSLRDDVATLRRLIFYIAGVHYE